jgi:hypothetical protein
VANDLAHQSPSSSIDTHQRTTDGIRAESVTDQGWFPIFFVTTQADSGATHFIEHKEAELQSGVISKTA